MANRDDCPCRACWMVPLVYLVVGFLTFAYIYGDDAEWIVKGEVDVGDRVGGSMLGGLFWPVYVMGKGSLFTVQQVRGAMRPTPAPMCDVGGLKFPSVNGVCKMP